MLERCCHADRSELGTSLFEITQLLFTLEQTLISGANEQFKKKSNER